MIARHSPGVACKSRAHFARGPWARAPRRANLLARSLARWFVCRFFCSFIRWLVRSFTGSLASSRRVGRAPRPSNCLTGRKMTFSLFSLLARPPARLLVWPAFRLDFAPPAFLRPAGVKRSLQRVGAKQANEYALDTRWGRQAGGRASRLARTSSQSCS